MHFVLCDVGGMRFGGAAHGKSNTNVDLEGDGLEAAMNKALDAVLKNWEIMSQTDEDEAESAADTFQSSFYTFIDSVRDWYNGLQQQPKTLEDFLDMPIIQDIVDLLPAPLHLNFETEAELIMDGVNRIDEDNYD